MPVDIFRFLNLISSEHRNKPKFIATVTASVQPFVDCINQALEMPALFDVDTAVGDQLDIVGQYIGLTRNIIADAAQSYFSLDTPGAGFDQAVWQPPPPVVPQTAVIQLDDNDYRTLLLARIQANYWDGTRDGAYAAWNTLFNPRGLQVLIQEVQPKPIRWFSLDTLHAGFDQAAWYSDQFASYVAYNSMHVVLALIGSQIDNVAQALFTGGYLELVDAGVEIDNFALQSVPGTPIFALDVGPASGAATQPPYNLAGFDMGAWATLLPGD